MLIMRRLRKHVCRCPRVISYSKSYFQVSALIECLTDVKGVVDTAALLAAALSGGELSEQYANAVRANRLVKWLLRRPQTLFEIIVLMVIVSIVDRITYTCMGGEGAVDVEGRSRRPGTFAKCQQPIPIQTILDLVGSVRRELADVLRTWGQPGNPATDLFSAIGRADLLRDPQVWKFARVQVTHFSAGIYRKFECLLRGPPFSLWPLAGTSNCSQAVQTRVMDGFMTMRRCKLSAFCMQLVDFFNSIPKHVRVKLIAWLIEVWLRTLIWSTYASEREHNSVRKLAVGMGPAKNWSCVVSDRELEKVRAIHIQRTGKDPAVHPSLHKRAPLRLPVPNEAPQRPAVDNPLYGVDVQTQLQLMLRDGGADQDSSVGLHGPADSSTSASDLALLEATFGVTVEAPVDVVLLDQQAQFAR
jgi:hypothetical protein